MIYIPKRIKVGYNNRSDTYTGKLAYVIYYDEYGKLHKEPSWNSWRNEKIEPDEYDNIPTEGFVLNKKVGGYYYHFDARQTYVRVYDPRGFEFEISVPNLLYILEYSNSLRGKGLQSAFVYGWDGKELVLVPTDAEEYKRREETARKLYPQIGEYIKPKDLKIGYKYKAKSGTIIYMGYFDYYDYHNNEVQGKCHFYFTQKQRSNGELYWWLENRVTINKFVLENDGDDPAIEYPELLDELERSYHYSPIDDTKDRYVDCSYEEFADELRKYHRRFYTDKYNPKETVIIPNNSTGLELFDVRTAVRKGWQTVTETIKSGLTAKELYNYINPKKKQVFLRNGKLFKEYVGDNGY